MVKNLKPGFRNRLQKLRRRMAEEDLDYVVIVDEPRLHYLCGYSGSNGLLVIGHNRADFLTDARYTTQARTEVKGAKVTIAAGDLVTSLPRLAHLHKGRKKIGYENATVSEVRAQRLREAVPSGFWVGFGDLVGPLMEVKDGWELDAITRAVRVADIGFSGILDHIRPGVREREVAAELEYIMKMAGSEAIPFETIVASGPRSALPHGRASVKRIRKGDFVTLDFGATVDGYVSDITRTVIVGKPNPRQKRVYEIVQRAQATAVRKARPGLGCAALDGVARSIIAKAGYGKEFGHGLGHGIGLQVHEGPSVNAKSTTTLRPGMVITVEPGIYFPGWGGVRIEDDVVITSSGHRVLNQSERKLLVL